MPVDITLHCPIKEVSMGAGKCKVFCSECHYFIQGRMYPSSCNHPSNMKDSPFYRGGERMNAPESKNRNNDCQDFEWKREEKKGLLARLFL
jgi:hypothetical protein